MPPDLIDDRAQLGPVLACLRGADRVAVDTEFHPERRRTPKLYVLSLAVDGADPFLVDASKTQLLEALRPAMEGATWILHGGRVDLPLLEPTLGRPGLVIDTQILAGLCTTIYPARLDQLLTNSFEGEQTLSITMSDWSKRPLSREQRAYAAADTGELLSLADRLQSRVAALGRASAARKATEEYVEKAYAPEPQLSGLRGAERLSPRNAAAAEELLHWRTATARRLNKPDAAVLGDGQILDLAKRLPLTVQSIRANRRFPKAVATQHGEAIVEIVHRVARRPDHLLPRTRPRGSWQEYANAWWHARTMEKAQASDFSAALLFPPAVIEALIADRPVDGWRADEIAGWVESQRSAAPAPRDGDRHSPIRET